MFSSIETTTALSPSISDTTSFGETPDELDQFFGEKKKLGSDQYQRSMRGVQSCAREASSTLTSLQDDLHSRSDLEKAAARALNDLNQSSRRVCKRDNKAEMSAIHGQIEGLGLANIDSAERLKESEKNLAGHLLSHATEHVLKTGGGAATFLYEAAVNGPPPGSENPKRDRLLRAATKATADEAIVDAGTGLGCVIGSIGGGVGCVPGAFVGRLASHAAVAAVDVGGPVAPLLLPTVEEQLRQHPPGEPRPFDDLASVGVGTALFAEKQALKKLNQAHEKKKQMEHELASKASQCADNMGVTDESLSRAADTIIRGPDFSMLNPWASSSS